MGNGVEGDRNTLYPRTQWGDPTQSTPVILFVSVAVKSLVELGHQYEWPRNQVCPECGSRLWGHGFISAWFDGCPGAVRLPRYRCSHCRKVFRVRPVGYWSRFQASISDISQSLTHRLNLLRWPSGRSSSRQRHWLSGLKKQIFARWGANWAGSLLDAFDLLCRDGIPAVSRSI
jgi:DNA-directed RNA polymerase subunit RPC12/RpoP